MNQELSKVIYLMGPPGSGKGTQAELLSKKLGYIQFSTGDAFREAMREETDLGRSVRDVVNNGFLAPPEMAAEIVMNAVKKHIENGRGLVFDGTPRTIKEADIIDDFFEEKKYGQPLIMFLDIDKDEMIKRNSKRKFCVDIKGGFPVVDDSGRKKCEEMGGKVGTREDDAPEKFMTRWSQFEELTLPVVERYRARGVINEIDGDRSIEEVQQEIMDIVNKKSASN